MSTAVPRPRVIAVLLAGRGLYRVAGYAGGLALLALWGPTAFAAYAAPLGALAWLTALVSSGPEKAALNLVPLRGGAHLDGFFRRLAVASFAVCLLLGSLGLLSTSALPYAAAGVFAAGLGSATVLVALYRLRGRPLVDSFAYLGLAGAYAVAIAAAYLGAEPVQVLLLLCVTVLVVNAALLTGLRRPVPVTEETISRPAALRAAVVLGAAEVFGIAGVSALYATFAAAGEPAETSLFYVLVLISSAFSTGWGYVLRLAQPSVAVRIEHSGEAAGWVWARRCLMWTLIGGVPGGAIMLLFGRSTAWAYAGIGIEIALYAANAGSALLLEASGSRGRRRSASSAVVQLVAVAVTGWFLVPLAGAAGGVTALVAGELTRAGLLLVLTRPD